MKRYLLLVFSILLTCSFAIAQDVIIYQDGTEINSKVIKVGKEEIVYKKYNNLNGPEYTEDIMNVFMIKYEGGTKDVFKNNNSTNKKDENEELYTLNAGELISLYFRESLNSKDISNGQLIKLAVKEDVISKNNKVIIAANTQVNGRISSVKKAAWAGQKGKLSIQINSIKAVDGTSIAVYYNLNNEGKSRQAASIGLAIIAWPTLFIKGKQASIEAGSLILVETMSNVTLNTSNFPIYIKNESPIIIEEDIKKEEVSDNENEEKITELEYPKRYQYPLQPHLPNKNGISWNKAMEEYEKSKVDEK
jgi:hypothetical protein